MKRLRNYFIGEYLSQEKDLLKRASIQLICNVLLICVVVLVLILASYIGSGYILKSGKVVLIIVLFMAALFGIKIFKQIEPVGHFMIVTAWVNSLVDIYVVYHDILMYTAFIAGLTIVFAFHVLENRWGFFYAALHFISFAGIFLLKGLNLIPSTPTPVLPISEGIASFSLVFFVLVYLVYHYHQAFRLARESINQSMVELREAKEMAEEMNRLKTNFLSNMSHEIRTPINGILGISQIIEMETRDTRILEYISMQKKSGRRLLDTIESILNLSRLEARKEMLELASIDLNKLVSESANSLQELAHRKGIQFAVNTSRENIQVLSDETMLYQVLQNIVGNAIKFTESGGVEVSVVAHEAGTKALIRVRDTGIGISKDFLPKIFNAFEQESMGHSRAYEGSGLGLSISKRYIELLGGSIVVESAKNEGSIFEISLPRYKKS